MKLELMSSLNLVLAGPQAWNMWTEEQKTEQVSECTSVCSLTGAYDGTQQPLWL